MSFILDALRKAERDKQRGSTPNMHDVMHAPPLPATPSGTRIPWMLIAIVLGLLALFIGLLPESQQRPQSPQAMSSPGARQNPQPRDVPSTETTPARTTAAAAQVARTALPSEADERVAAVMADEPIDAQSFDELMDEPEAAVGDPSPTAADLAREAEDPEPPDAPPARPAKPSPPPAAPPSTPEATAPNSNTGSDPLAKPLRDMPDSYRASFPNIRVDVHVYNDEPARRWVLIDGKRYAEGQTLAGGAFVDQIVSEGVVIGFRNEKILLRVGQ